MKDALALHMTLMMTRIVVRFFSPFLFSFPLF
jgi:hypothetical protein